MGGSGAITALLTWPSAPLQCGGGRKSRFADVRATGRETWAAAPGGDGCAARGRHTTADSAPADRDGRTPRDRRHRRGPAYTSVGAALAQPLQQQTSDPSTVTVHHGAAARSADVDSAWHQASAGSPAPTADACGPPPADLSARRTTRRSIVLAHRSTHTTRGARSTGQLHRQRPTPFGPPRAGELTLSQTRR